MKGYREIYGKFSVTGLLLLFGLISWFLILPYITNVIEKVQLKNELTEQVAFSNNWEENYNELVEYRNELEEGINALDKNRLEPDDSYLLIDAIYEISEATFVQILSINPSDITSNQIIDLELNGRYHAIATFINKLESSSYSLVIPEIQLTKASNADLLHASVTLDVEYNRN